MDERAYLSRSYSENLMSFHRLETPFNKSIKTFLVTTWLRSSKLPFGQPTENRDPNETPRPI